MDPLLHTWPVSSTVMLWGSKSGRGSVLRLVRLTIGFCSLNFSIVAFLFLLSGGARTDRLRAVGSSALRPST